MSRSVLIAVCLVVCLGACSRQTPLQDLVERTRTTDLKVLIVGIDGATFSVIDSMVAQGRLPVMKRLMDGGVRAVLESDPPMSSPALWMSIATGRSRIDHGVEGFVVMLADSAAVGKRSRLANSNDRDITAIWNWVGPFGKTVGFSGWWVTWPAEPVNGWMISDRLTRNLWDEWVNEKQVDYLTFPDELVVDLFPLVVDLMQPLMDEITALVSLTPDETREFLAAESPVMGHGLSVFKFSYAAQRTYERFALHMLDQGQPDLTGLFLIALDPVQHTFWHYYEPDAFDGVDSERARRLGRLVPNMYEHNDRVLGQVLERVDDKTVVFVVSDHGFRASGELPRQVSTSEFPRLQSKAVEDGTVAVGQSGEHDKDGILIAFGPGIKPGATTSAHLFDIAPTILALMGLPVADNMDGRVLTEIIEPAFFTDHPVTTISSYRDYFDRTRLAIGADVNQDELIERLRSLGYIQ